MLNLTQDEKDFLTSQKAVIRGDRVYMEDGVTEVPEDTLNRILTDYRRARDASRGSGGARPRVKDMGPAQIIDEDSDDSERGYESQRRYRGSRESNRTTSHRSGWSAPKTRAEAEDTDMGYIPTRRENSHNAFRTWREQANARKEVRGQKRRKIKEYAVNEMKYARPIVFLDKKPVSPDKKFWVAIEYNPKTGKGTRVDACASKEDAMRKAEAMCREHPGHTHKVAYTDIGNIKSNGTFKLKPKSVYQLS